MLVVPEAEPGGYRRRPENWDYGATLQEHMIEADHWDQLLIPGGNFISDFALSAKGIEAPTSFAVWTAISCISAALKRDVYLSWLSYAPLYGHFYTFLVSPPGIAKKGGAMGKGEYILKIFPSYLFLHSQRVNKAINFHQGSITPEALRDLLLPPPPYFIKDEDGRTRKVKRGSQTTFWTDELAVMLNKRQYNESLIDRLTALFDTKASDGDRTKGEGEVALEDIYVTFFGGATPDTLNDAIPERAFGGGFLSRTILVYEERKGSIHSRPIDEMKGFPSNKELAKRLAWIIGNAEGEYDFSSEAEALHDEWYREFYVPMIEGLNDEMEQKKRSRMDIHLRKLALICRVARYEPGSRIEVGDWKMAKGILDKTWASSHFATDDIGGGRYQKGYNRVRNLIRRRDKVNRKQVVHGLSRYVNSNEIRMIIEQLHQAGLIKTIGEGGRELEKPRHRNDEGYLWTGGKEE